MKIVKYSLMTMGAAFFCVVLAIGYLLFDGFSTKNEVQKFASGFLQEFSQSWNVDSVKDILTEDNLRQLRGLQGAAILHSLSALGRFQSLDSFSIVNHSITGSGRFSTFEFNGNFENAQVFGQMSVIQSDSGMKVKDFIVKPIGPIKPTIQSKSTDVGPVPVSKRYSWLLAACIAPS